MIRTTMFLLALIQTTRVFAGELTLGQPAPKFQLSGENGARINGEPWSSNELIGDKITTFFYIDPEERAKNEPVEAAYKKADFPRNKHHSVAVINMAAAWYPNSVLNSQLESKQKEFPHTIYLKDFKKAFVSAWGLEDDSVNLVIFDKDSKVLYLKKGPMNEKDIDEALSTIRTKLAAVETPVPSPSVTPTPVVATPSPKATPKKKK